MNDTDLKKLQLQLNRLDLNLKIRKLQNCYFCSGKIHTKDIAMVISFERDGFRNSMYLDLYGQKENLLIPIFSDFMNYQPFCKYQNSRHEGSSVTYEWKRKNPEKRYCKLMGYSSEIGSGIWKLSRLKEVNER